jgi:hypothetical protein
MIRRFAITGAAMLLSALTASTSGGQEATTAVDFTGTYSVSINGQRSVMRLTQSGTEVTGQIDEAKVVGKVEGQQAQVQIIDTGSGQAVGAAAMQRVGEQVFVLIGVRDPDSGEIIKLPLLTFSREAAQPATQPQPQAQQQQPQQQQQQPVASAQLDQRLVGRWLYTHTYVSGDFTAASDTWFILNADGTYQYGGGRAAAGGAGSSMVTDRANMETGRWRAEDKTLYAMPEGSSEWSVVGTYMVDDNNFLLKSGGGGKRIFSRQ